MQPCGTLHLIRLKIKCEFDAISSIPQEGLFVEYMNYCQANILNPIQMPELLKLSKKMHPDINVSVEPPMVMGLRLKVDAPVEEEEVEDDRLYCGFPGCEAKFDSIDELTQHVRKHEVKSNTCPWKHCGKKCTTQKSLQHHMKTHIPLPFEKAIKEKPKPFVPDNDEIKGIPLSALLVIRNIAKHEGNHVYFAPFEKDLATMLTNAKYNKTIASILAELK